MFVMIMEKIEPEFVETHINYSTENETNKEPIVESGQAWTNSLDRTTYYKLVEYCVKDLLQSVKQDDHFVVRNNAFVFAMICGTIVSKSIYNSRVSIQVNDGTASITCLLDQDFFPSESGRNKGNSVTYQSCENNQSQSVAMICGCINDLMKEVPQNEEDLKIGGVVLVKGKLSQDKGTFYIFADKLLKKDIGYFIMHLNHLRDSYEHDYVTV